VQFITSLFGGGDNTLLTTLFALGAVLVLIVLGVWLLKLVFSVSSNGVRGRNRRLAVIDTLALDQKRQLLIVRRDNVEHLILTGGPQDLVVETGIAVEEVQPAQPSRRPIPMVGGRRAPEPRHQPQAEPTAGVPVTATPGPAAPVAATPATAIERLRELGRPANQRAARSLRHTGLLRPVTTQDPLPAGQNPDISGEPATDSAKQDAGAEASQDAAFEQTSTSEANRS